MITRRQIRAARAMVGISLRELAGDAGIGIAAVHDIETGKTASGRGASLDALQRSLERRGVQFARDGWVRHSEDDPEPVAALAPTVIAALTRTCRAAREAHGWTRDDLAAHVGVTPDLYGRIEDGVVVPSLAVMIQIGAALHLSLDALLGLSHAHWGAGALPRTARASASTDPLAERLHRASAGFRRAVMMLLLELEK